MIALACFLMIVGAIVVVYCLISQANLAFTMGGLAAILFGGLLAVLSVVKQKKSVQKEINAELVAKENQRTQVLRGLGFSEKIDLEILQKTKVNLMNQLKDLKKENIQLRSQIEEIKYSEKSAKENSCIKECQLALESAKAHKEHLLREYFTLFLTYEILDQANAEWKKNNQPDIFNAASKNLALLTEGSWVSIFSEGGQLYVGSSDEVIITPQQMSLSARQQLYLSLRMAILSSDTGQKCAVPIVADDILVNFDERRQQNALLLLIKFAQQRQIIMFTCHKNIYLQAKKAADLCSSKINCVELR